MIVFWPLAFCASWALLILCLLPFEDNLAPWIRRSGLGFIGLCSYSLYLLHPLVINTFNQSLNAHTITIPGKLYFAFMMVAVLATAIGGYLLVEKPFMKKRTKYLATPKPPVAPPDEVIGAEREVIPVG